MRAGCVWERRGRRHLLSPPHSSQPRTTHIPSGPNLSPASSCAPHPPPSFTCPLSQPLPAQMSSLPLNEILPAVLTGSGALPLGLPQLLLPCHPPDKSRIPSLSPLPPHPVLGAPRRVPAPHRVPGAVGSGDRGLAQVSPWRWSGSWSWAPAVGGPARAGGQT